MDIHPLHSATDIDEKKNLRSMYSLSTLANGFHTDGNVQYKVRYVRSQQLSAVGMGSCMMPCYQAFQAFS
jgi:hypothetical protein